MATQRPSQTQMDTSGHDWWHIHRVSPLAVQIGKPESADLFIVQLAAICPRARWLPGRRVKSPAKEGNFRA